MLHSQILRAAKSQKLVVHANRAQSYSQAIAPEVVNPFFQFTVLGKSFTYKPIPTYADSQTITFVQIQAGYIVSQP